MELQPVSNTAASPVRGEAGTPSLTSSPVPFVQQEQSVVCVPSAINAKSPPESAYKSGYVDIKSPSSTAKIMPVLNLSQIAERKEVPDAINAALEKIWQQANDNKCAVSSLSLRYEPAWLGVSDDYAAAVKFALRSVK